MKQASFILIVWLCLAARAHATLLNNCIERTPTVTLTGSDVHEGGRAWNVERNGVKYWDYEGTNRVVKINDNYTGGYSLTLESFACSEHFNFYYTTAGAQSVNRLYVEQLATQLEAAWTELTHNQAFRTPLNLKAEGRYEVFTNFTRIPVLVHDTPNGKSGANFDPRISLVRGLDANSRTPNHELFHIIKHGYARFNAAWFNEGLARWSERFVAGATAPCNGFTSYKSITYNLLQRDYCDSAAFFNYLGMKYGTVWAGSDGSDVIRAILGEMGAVTNNKEAMLAIERALDRFRGEVTGYGRAYKEWAKGNYVDDTGNSPVLRAHAPREPRWKEAGEIGIGGDQYVWHDYTFYNPSRGDITIQIRAVAGDLDHDGDDDDLRLRLDGALLGDWNSANAFDGSAQGGKIRTIHIVRRDVSLGSHTIRLEADEHPTLLAINVFSGEVPLLFQGDASPELCDAGFLRIPCYAQDGDPAVLSGDFNVPAGVSLTTVLLEGRAATADFNAAWGYPDEDDNARVRIDGGALGDYDTEKSLDGDLQDLDLAAVEMRINAALFGRHTIDVKTIGKPYIDHLMVQASPEHYPLLHQVGGRLDSWSANYHVIPVTQDLLPPDGDVLAPRSLTVEMGTWTWSDEFAPPFHHVLLIDHNDNLYQSLTAADSFGVTRSITPDTLRRLGAGGRIVVVVGTTDATGTYFVRVKR